MGGKKVYITKPEKGKFKEKRAGKKKIKSQRGVAGSKKAPWGGEKRGFVEGKAQPNSKGDQKATQKKKGPKGRSEKKGEKNRLYTSYRKKTGMDPGKGTHLHPGRGGGGLLRGTEGG